MVSQLKESRILFHKGMQRKFLELVIERLQCFSLRGILQFGFDIPYSTLKNYYTERRLLPLTLFESLCHLAKIDVKSLKIQYVSSNWGQVLGGKSEKR